MELVQGWANPISRGSPEVIEAQAIKLAFLQAKKLKLEKLIVECDSKILDALSKECTSFFFFNKIFIQLKKKKKRGVYILCAFGRGS